MIQGRFSTDITRLCNVTGPVEIEFYCQELLDQ